MENSKRLTEFKSELKVQDELSLVGKDLIRSQVLLQKELEGEVHMSKKGVLNTLQLQIKKQQ